MSKHKNTETFWSILDRASGDYVCETSLRPTHDPLEAWRYESPQQATKTMLILEKGDTQHKLDLQIFRVRVTVELDRFVLSASECDKIRREMDRLQDEIEDEHTVELRRRFLEEQQNALHRRYELGTEDGDNWTRRVEP